MEEEFTPAVEEVVLAHGIASVLIWGVVAGVVLLLQLPRAYIFPVLQVGALAPVAYFVVMSAQALWLRFTVHYYIGDGFVRKRGGWFSKYSAQMALSDVRKTDVETPLLLRAFGVGHMWVIGNDCHAFMLRNVKYPYSVADKILPPREPELVFRPSVG